MLISGRPHPLNQINQETRVFIAVVPPFGHFRKIVGGRNWGDYYSSPSVFPAQRRWLTDLCCKNGVMLALAHASYLSQETFIYFYCDAVKIHISDANLGYWVSTTDNDLVFEYRAIEDPSYNSSLYMHDN